MLRRAILFFTLLAAGIAPAHAQSPRLSEIEALQARDIQLFRIGWKLAAGNAPYCADAAPAIGALFHDAASYGKPDRVRQDLGLVGDIAVQAVAPGSPAAAAGLTRNAALLDLNGAIITEAFPPSDPRWQRMVSVNAAIDAALTEGPARFGWASAGEVPQRAVVTGVLACPSRFEVFDGGKRAVADGSRVIFGRDFAGFAYAEDEFAAAVAHELAHNLLKHRRMFDAVGRSQSLVRLTERDADRMMPWLLYNAGYDPRAAVRFMTRWGPKYGGGLLRDRSHDGWDERVEFIEAEIATMEAALAETGAADWSQRFVPMAKPD